ncbi:hypothetical protein FNF28_05981 [Cafeteria roenbergensis]|uniref:GH3 auxin-responsive promoter n=1 Tax=Cafeteria roenbergensis TaxID=33653 RepID=A0A5A8D2U2_CAFRO|nr:hypothetical protein FNF28_05981 [Cafeteria roenbergensis]
MSGNRALRIVSGTVGLAGAGLLYARWYVDKECKKLERSETHDDATALKQYMMFRYFRLHDYVPFVQRTLDGEPGLLLSPRAPPTMFVASAGTTGPPKWLPMTKQQQEFYTMYSTGFTYGRMFAWRPDTFSLRRSCRLLFPGSAGTSSAGIPMGADAAVSTGSAKERLPVYSTPEAAFAVEHAPSLLYLHLLFALRDRDLSSIQAEYAPALLAMLALLDDPDTRAALLSDLEGGTISQDLTMALPSAFFEFIPVDAAPAPASPPVEASAPPVEASAPPAGGPTTRLLHELEAGRRYEVVVTTKSGLWRYRTGDVVQVVGLQQGALPVVRLLYRKQDSLALPAARHGQSAGSQAAGEAEHGAVDGSPAGPDGVSSGAQPQAEAEAAEEVVLTTADVETALRSCEAVWSGTASADGASDSLGDGSSTGSVAGWFASGAQTRGSATEPVDPLFSLGNFAMALVEAGGGALAARVAVEAWAEDCEGEAALPAGAAAALDRQLCRASAAYAEARRQGRLEEVRLTGLPGSASDELWLRRANANSELAALLKPQMRLSADAPAAAPSEAGASERA